jgi:hypothetical protein
LISSPWTVSPVEADTTSVTSACIVLARTASDSSPVSVA